MQDKAIPKKTAEKNPLFPNSEIPSRTGNKFEKDIYEHIQRIFK